MYQDFIQAHKNKNAKIESHSHRHNTKVSILGQARVSYLKLNLGARMILPG